MGDLPVWLLVLDYVLGIIMWTLIARTALALIMPAGRIWGFQRIIERTTEPLITLWRPITPGFLLAPLVPVYVAWFFYMIRFYLMPWLLGYSVMGMLSFPLESEFAHGVANLIGKLVGE